MTACRNRLHHLAETLPQNLENNKQPFVKFVVLNYGSQDDMDKWMQEHTAKYIPSGRLTYIQLEADRWRHAHARNVMVRCADTDVICNVDADNFTGPGFGRWLSGFYAQHLGDKVFTAYGPPEGCPRGDFFGRISFLRKHLLALGGYNEDMNIWGAEDWDIIKRAEGVGLRRHTYPKEFWVEPIAHSNMERVQGSGYDSTHDAHVEMVRRHAGKFAMGNMTPNARAAWGVATVRVNWKKEVKVPLGPKETLT